jgi:cysteine desulfurase
MTAGRIPARQISVHPVPPALADGPIYLDYNAATPVDPRVAEAMSTFLTNCFGNPSSGHTYADHPRRAPADAREKVAGLIGAQAGDIVFTGSGSEADNLAIRGAFLAHDTRDAHDGRDARPAHVITQVTEHPGRVHLNGHPVHRLPGTLNISITGTRADRLLAAAPGIAAATGSACHTGDPQPSPVLTAMGLPTTPWPHSASPSAAGPPAATSSKQPLRSRPSPAIRRQPRDPLALRPGRHRRRRPRLRPPAAGTA